MKKSKLIALLTAVMLIINTLFISVPAFAADTTTSSTVTRFDGANRYEVAVNVSKATYPNGTPAVILVNGSDATLADGLAAAPLAKALKAPILLTDKDSVPSATSAEITRLGADKVYVVGGSGSVSDAIVNQYSATRIGGADRYAVAENVADQLKAALGVTSFDKAFISNGLKYADALGAAPFAAQAGEPILFVTTNTNDPATKATISDLDTLGVTATDAIGGSASLPDAVVSAVNGTRVNGINRAALSAAIAAKYASAPTTAYVVNGYKPADALSIGPLAATTGSPVLFVDSNGTYVDPSVTSYYKANASTITSLIPVGGTASVTDAAVNAVKYGNPTSGLSVTSVAASAANAIKVTFNGVPSDTSTVTFTVKRDGTAVTVSPTWDGATATLTYSANFPEGTYTVDVANGSTDLGSSTVSITQQKVAKIALTSNTLAVTPATNGTAEGSQYGYIGYKVFDQYGTDISDKTLASNVQWSCGLGQTSGKGIEAKNGILKIENPENMLFTQFTTTVITAVDTNSAVSLSQTVNISLSQGTLSSITLNSLTNADNAAFTSDSTAIFYVDYTAKDVSGNETKSLELVKHGLIYSNSPKDVDKDELDLFVASPYINAQVVPDPNDDTKAAIQVTVNTDAAKDIYGDIPITITAIPSSGSTSSQLSVTLKKAASLDTFTMSAPATEIACGETVNIPFVAYDQNGNQLTKYTDFYTANDKGEIVWKVTFSTTLPNKPQIVENADGTAALQVKLPDQLSGNQQSQTFTIQAITATNNITSINLTVEKIAEPATLKLGTPTKYMEKGTSQSWDANDIFTVLDQYGRTIDLTNGNEYNGSTYSINAVDSASKYFGVTGEAGSSGTIALTAKDEKGSETITFNLLKDSTVIDSKTATFTVVDPTDVVGYTLDDMGTIYNTGKAYNTNDYYNDFQVNPSVKGKLANGASVIINDPVTSVSSNDTEINAFVKDTDSINVYGNGGDDGRNATITVIVQNTGDHKYYSASNTVKATTAAPIAQSMGFDTPSNQGVTVDSATNNVTIDSSKGFDFSKLYGKQITRWYNNSNANVASIDLYAVDQYGKNDAPIANVQVLDSTKDLVSISANNTLQFNRTIKDGDFITLQAVATNGKTETVRINFIGDAGEDTTAPIVTGVENDKTYNTDVTPAFTEGTATLAKDGETAKAFTTGTKVSDEGNYVLVVTDAVGNATTVNFTIDKTAPTFTASRTDTNQITVVFSEKVDQTSAEKIANYTYKPDGSAAEDVVSATLQSDGKTVILTTTTDPTASTSTIDATVEDMVGNVSVSHIVTL